MFCATTAMYMETEMVILVQSFKYLGSAIDIGGGASRVAEAWLPRTGRRRWKVRKKETAIYIPYDDQVTEWSCKRCRVRTYWKHIYIG